MKLDYFHRLRIGLPPMGISGSKARELQEKLYKPMKTTVKIEVKLDDKAVKAMDQIIDNWRAAPGDDADLRKCYTQDRKDLRRVQTLYKKGQWAKAGEFASHLDTLVRDMIPNSIWESIQTAYSGHEE